MSNLQAKDKKMPITITTTLAMAMVYSLMKKQGVGTFIDAKINVHLRILSQFRRRKMGKTLKMEPKITFATLRSLLIELNMKHDDIIIFIPSIFFDWKLNQKF